MRLKYVAWMRGGAQARFQFKGKKYSKFFPGKDHETLMQKAYQWVMVQRKKLGVIVGVYSRYKRKTNGLPVGVTVCDSRRKKHYAHQYYAKAYINIGGAQKIKRFSFVVYGKDLAIQLAKVWRIQQENNKS